MFVTNKIFRKYACRKKKFFLQVIKNKIDLVLLSARYFIWPWCNKNNKYYF